VGADVWCSDAGSGPPVLVVHGAGTHGPLWSEDLQPLTASHRLIVPTRRGYPGSPPSPRDWSAHTDEMVTLLDAVRVPSAAVVGHSAGCIVALDLALRYSSRVERLVLLDPAVRVRSFLTPAFVLAFTSAQLLRRFGAKQRALARWFGYALSYRGGGTAWERLPQARREALLANADGVFADFASGDGSAQIDDERLRVLSLPVTIVIAGQTPETLRRSGEHLAATIPGAERVVIEDAGHALAFDRPTRLHEVLSIALLEQSAEVP
jgi:pimeloyl-ACP methyl ester carboxylesterase